jgi:hypothetical protein
MPKQMGEKLLKGEKISFGKGKWAKDLQKACIIRIAINLEGKARVTSD